MRIYAPVELVITPTIKNRSKAKRATDGVEAFLLNFPKIVAEFRKRAEKSAIDIAPRRTGGLAGSITTVDYRSEGFMLMANPENDASKKTRDGWVTNSKVRGIMMEFGYPYSTNYWGPYLPNPSPGFKGISAHSTTKSYKNKKKGSYVARVASKKGTENLKGLGYLRVSYIIAARSLFTDKTNYSRSGLSLARVRSYVSETQTEFVGSLQKLLVKYIQGSNLPKYLSTKSVIKSPLKMDLKGAGFRVDNLLLEIPIDVIGDEYFNRYRVGANLRGVSTGFMPPYRPFAEGYDFATDDNSFPSPYQR